MRKIVLDHELMILTVSFSYIRDLDPHYILALVETAPKHQVLALRDAISNHLSKQTAMRVHVIDVRDWDAKT